MATKIIKRGNKKFSCVCPICGCEFEYTVEDISHSIIAEGYYVRCPDCEHSVPHEGNVGEIRWQRNKDEEFYVDYKNPPYTFWTQSQPDSCEDCPWYKSLKDKQYIVGDTPCAWCKKRTFYCSWGHTVTNTTWQGDTAITLNSDGSSAMNTDYSSYVKQVSEE